MKKLALLLLLAGCTSTDVVLATASGDRLEVHSTRLFNQTAMGFSPDGSFTYSSDPQAQAAADLVKTGIALGLKSAAVPVP